MKIPKLCCDEGLRVSGRCGACLVRVEGIKEPVLACRMRASPEMIITTNTSKEIQ